MRSVKGGLRKLVVAGFVIERFLVRDLRRKKYATGGMKNDNE